MNQICHASRNANALALIWGAHQHANDHVVLDVSLSPIHTSVISKSMFVMQSSPHPFQENWHMIVSCFTHPYQTTLGMLMLLFLQLFSNCYFTYREEETNFFYIYMS